MSLYGKILHNFEKISLNNNLITSDSSGNLLFNNQIINNNAYINSNSIQFTGNQPVVSAGNLCYFNTTSSNLVSNSDITITNNTLNVNSLKVNNCTISNLNINGQFLFPYQTLISELTITSSQIGNLSSYPGLTLVSSPGVGKVLIPISMEIYTPGITNYNVPSNTNFFINYTGNYVNGTDSWNWVVPVNGLLDQTTSKVYLSFNTSQYIWLPGYQNSNDLIIQSTNNITGSGPNIKIRLVYEIRNALH